MVIDGETVGIGENMVSSKTAIIIGSFILLSIILIGTLIGSYNGLVDSSQNVDAKWSQVDIVMQRRADLVPNLVATVKGATQQEQDIKIEATRLRSQWGAAKTIDEKIANDGELSQVLSRLLMIQESYPDMQTNENFLALQAQLEGAESRISTERGRYTEAAKEYNQRINHFPTSILAKMYGFNPKPYFESTDKGKEVPVVDFSK